MHAIIVSEIYDECRCGMFLKFDLTFLFYENLISRFHSCPKLFLFAQAFKNILIIIWFILIQLYLHTISKGFLLTNSGYHMLENLAIISLIGFVIGFIFSVPVAGPVSIMITAGALQGKRAFCLQVNAGAALVEFLYVFIGVYGLTRLFALYYPFIPYILIGGSIFLIYLGYRITRSDLDIDVLEKSNISAKRRRKPGGFLTGILINLFNPALFIGWLTSSFLVISFIAGLGYSTGGINDMLNERITEVNNIEISEKRSSGKLTEITAEMNFGENKPMEGGLQKKHPPYYPLIISSGYAFFLSIGSVVWFVILTNILIRYRNKLNIKILSKLVRTMGYILYLISVILFYSGISKII